MRYSHIHVSSPRTTDTPLSPHAASSCSSCPRPPPPAAKSVSIRQHTSAYVSIRQHTSAYVSIRQHASACVSIPPAGIWEPSIRFKPKRFGNDSRAGATEASSACSSIRQHTSAYGSIRTLELAQRRPPPPVAPYVSIRQHTAAYGGLLRL